ncbi:MAG TPA: hypothetical protein VNR39_01935 [Pseudolabrys sp.]|nr:hypothetical protein [Pseudolabrys sp.]
MKRIAAIAGVLLAMVTAGARAAEPVAALPLVRDWVRFTDPQERAFSVDVPRLWKVEGGTARWNALQYRFWLRAASPDGNTILAINDPAEPFFVVPTSTLAGAGFHEGSDYSPTGVTFYKVARYRDGAQYSASWGEAKLASLCESVRLVSSRPLPELSQLTNRYAAAVGMHRDEGEAAFSCRRHGVAMTAYVQTSINSIGNQAGGMWWADQIVGFLAPAPVSGMAAGLLAHMLRTAQLDPAWSERQLGTNAAVSRITTANNAAISDIIMRGWAERGAVIDRVMEEGSRARLGIDVYADPATGTEYVVGLGNNYYWTNAAGQVVGTDTDIAPYGWRRLSRVPPR